MLTIENLERFTKQSQTSLDNVVREYCQHLFLSYLYQQPGADRLLFKGGTALRFVFRSPRYSEDLDFTGINITERDVEALFLATLDGVEQTGIRVALEESKRTSGGYLGQAIFSAYGRRTAVEIQVSLRRTKALRGVTAVIVNEYIPTYTLVHLPKEEIVRGKLEALFDRQKPRDFYDFFFLLSGDQPLVRDRATLTKALALLRASRTNFRAELQRFLPASHVMHLRDFKRILERKVREFIG